MRKKQFFKRIFLSFVFFIIIYTCISVGVFIIKSQEINKYRINNTQQTFFDSSVKTMDNALTVGSNWIYQLKNDKDIRDYANSDQVNYNAITQIYYELGRTSAVFSNVGYQVGVSKPDENLVITPLGTSLRTFFFDKLQINEDEIDKFTNESIRNNKEIAIKYFDSDAHLTIVRNEAIDDTIISFYLSLLKRSYLPNVQKGEGFGIVSEEGIITSIQKTEVSFDDILTDNIITELQMKSKDREGHIKITSNNYFIHVSRSDVLTDLYYVYVTPQSTLTYSIFSLQILIFLVLLILLGGGLALLFTNRTYKPLGNVMRVFQENSIKSDSESEDELKFIEENYIAAKEDNNRFRKIMNDRNIIFKEVFLKNLMFGLLTKTDINEGIEKYELSFLNDPLRVILIEFENYLKLEEDLPREVIHEIKLELLKKLREESFSELEFNVFELNYKQFGLIIKNQEINLLIKTLQTAFIQIEQQAMFNLIGAIGSVAEQNENLSKSYSEAQKLLEYRYALPEKTIIVIDDLKKIKAISYHYPLEKEKLLINHLVQGSEEKAVELLNEILNENLNERHMSTEEVEQFIHAISNTVSRVINLVNDDQIVKFNKDNILGKFILNQSYGSLIKYILNYVQQLLHHINENKEQMDEFRKDEMINFIHDHYQKDLSLHDLAENFNLSAGYISSLFKNNTGENFVVYLNKYRIQVAKEMLKKEEFKVAEIAEKVGYNNTNSFIRVFKQYEGISPGKYIKEK